MAKISQNRQGNEAGNRKYQSNAPVKWGAMFARAGAHIAREGGTGEGEGVYLALAYAVENSERFLAWAKGVQHRAERVKVPAKAKAKAKAPAKAPAKAKTKAPAKAKAPEGQSSGEGA